ncbi:unnamed protein product [[Candida] boidinii]|uniref:Unnamed protein product n=1 Tax=Candida boidinii TaxID=5477 RepID=A0A9W6WK82_CANBO|nr:unnamed protein product [[Candida] boidinii]
MMKNLNTEKIKKSKQVIKEAKIKKLNQKNISKLKDEIKSLNDKKQLFSSTGKKLPFHEIKKLNDLNNDLKLYNQYNDTNNDPKKSRNDLNQDESTETSEIKSIAKKLGKSSIFYDPEWNPFGISPEGLENQEYTKQEQTIHDTNEDRKVILINKKSYQNQKSNEEQLSFINSIRLPNETKPRFYKIKNYKNEIENKEIKKIEIIKNQINSSNLIPTQIIKNNKNVK